MRGQSRRGRSRRNDRGKRRLHLAEEVRAASKSDMDVGDDPILGWDPISSRDLRTVYVDGYVSLRSGPARLQLDLLPAEARPTARAMSVWSRGMLHRRLSSTVKKVVDLVGPHQRREARRRLPDGRVEARDPPRPVQHRHRQVARHCQAPVQPQPHLPQPHTHTGRRGTGQGCDPAAPGRRRRAGSGDRGEGSFVVCS